MEVNLPRLNDLLSRGKEWRYENGQLKRKFRKSVYIGISAAAVMIILLAAFAIYSMMKKDILIVDADVESSISTFKSTVAEVLEERGIKVGPDDRLDAAPEEKLKDDMKIVIERAKPVMVRTKDRDILINTLAETVGEAMEEAGVYLGVLDRVEPDLDTPIEGIDSIEVIRVEEQIISQVEEVPFENQVKKNDKQEKGFVNVISKGKAGKKETSVRIVYENGVEAKRETVSEKIIQEPVAGVIEEGTKTTFVSSRGTVTRFTKAMMMTATAYDATFASTGKNPDHPQYGITRSGLRVRPGIVAVDPKVIPLGTWLYVEGYGEALAADTGGAIKGNKIDLYFESPSDVAKYGKRKVKVYILDKPKYEF